MNDVLTNTAIKGIPASKVKDQPIKPTVIEKLFLSGSDDQILEGESLDDDVVAGENEAEIETRMENSSSSGKRKIIRSGTGNVKLEICEPSQKTVRYSPKYDQASISKTSSTGKQLACML